MNRAIAAALVAASLFGLRDAGAQTVITPPDITSMGQHFVGGFSISPADDSIAFDLSVDASSGTALFSENIWTTAHTHRTSEQITMLADENVGSARQPAWNLDGFIGYLVFHSNVPAGATIVPGPELNVTTFGTISAALHVSGFSWSPEQDLLAFAGQDDAQAKIEFGDNGLYTVAVDGTGLTKILSCHPQCGVPQFSSTENVIAYSTGDIHLINPDGSGDHVTIQNAGDPVWSPGGTGQIAFGCGSDVCVASEDGAGRVNLTNGQSGLVFSQPTWSSDESLIVMVARPPHSATPGNLWVASPGGGTLQQLTAGTDANAPQWSPIIPDELLYICTRNFSDELCQLSGVGVPPAGCGGTTCSGCCQNGVCLPGTLPTACGQNGATCTACAGGDVCSTLGTCTNPTACNISNCHGCCDATNVCRAGSTTQACGKDGEPCARCVSGQICSGDEAICKTQLCSASNCSGCCGADGKCHGGTSNTACGSNGFVCDTCTGNSTCTTNRICEVQGCDISNCRSGCCDSSGHCRTGNSASACGSSGFACLDCGGQLCDANSRTCTPPETCSSANCLGCCDGGGHCQPGNNASACGFDGFTCQTCNSGERCSSSAGFCTLAPP